MAKATVKTKAKATKKPVKAGSSMRKNVGGVANAKVVAIVKKIKNR